MPSVASVIDGKSSNVENHFSNIYQSLYNSVNDQDEVNNILKNVHENICQDDIKDVRKVTPSIIKEAVAHLQNGKSDPVYDFSSDSHYTSIASNSQPCQPSSSLSSSSTYCER